MASALLSRYRMAAGTDGIAAGDLTTFNRWLNVSRIRAAAGLVLAVLALNAVEAGVIGLRAVVAVAALAVVTSLVGLRWRWLIERPRLLFGAQTVADLALVTVGLHLATHGRPALLFHGLYLLVLVPVSLVSVAGGLATAAIATVAHFWLLAAERGASATPLLAIDALIPPILFFLVAQQCFFYGGHLARKNRDLAALADRLEEHRASLAAEARTSAALVDVARALSSTLDATELLARVTHTMSDYLQADWGATFLVDAEHGTFRIAGATDDALRVDALEDMDCPLAGWPALSRLAADRIVVLEGEEASHVPVVFTGGRALVTVLLAGLYRAEVLTGFLAVGYRSGDAERAAGARRLVAGVAEHAAMALHNARLLSEVRLAADLKSEFVGAVSHELRSPLNVVIGYAEMLREGELGAVTEDQAGALARMHRQAVALLEMITALLDLNRFEAGRLPIAAAAVDVPELLTEVVEQLPAAWARPTVRLRVDTAVSLPPLVTDAGKLKTVLRNLLHNALKFTPAGEVTLVAEATADDGGIALRVHDTGIGIPADALPYVFEMFRQVPGTGGGGVGLGLHIVHRFVTALGGTVAVTSTVGVGTTFTVTLPAGAPAAEAA